MDFTIRKILLYSPLFICLLFSLLLLTINVKNKPSRYLAISLLTTAIQFILVAFQDYGNDQLQAIAYSTTYAVILSSAPLLYFYYKKLIIPNYKFSSNELFHFLPSIIFLVLHIFIFLNIKPESSQLIYTKQFAGIKDGLFTLYAESCKYHKNLYFIQVYAYGIYFLYLLYNHKKRIANFFSFTDKISLNWLLAYTIAYLIFTSLELFLAKSFPGNDPTLYFVIVNIYVLFIGCFGLKQNEIYSHSIIPDNNLSNSQRPKKQKFANQAKDNYTPEADPQLVNEVISPEIIEYLFKHKSNLSEEFKDSLYSHLITFIEQQKPYLNPELSIDDLAKNLNTSRNYLSIVINEKFKDNFFNFVNYYRIKEAISMIEDKSFVNYSLEGIAQTVGFKSRATFNPAFKKHTGKTPTEYKNIPNIE